MSSEADLSNEANHAAETVLVAEAETTAKAVPQIGAESAAGQEV